MKEKKMKTSKIKNSFLLLAATGLCVTLLIFFIGGIWIGFEVKSSCQEAESKYQISDCVLALEARLDDENEGYKARNNAIWALGQMGDNRSLPVLEKYYTGNIPPREPIDKVISQYELKKAIKLAAGGTNIAAWMWRGIGR